MSGAMFQFGGKPAGMAAQRNQEENGQKKQQKTQATKIQALARGRQDRKAKKRDDINSAATYIQANYKGHLYRKDAYEQQQKALLIQTQYRGHQVRARQAEEQAGARRIQSVQRGRMARRQYDEERASAVKIQAAFRGHSGRVAIEQMDIGAANENVSAPLYIADAAAVVIQCWFRGLQARRYARAKRRTKDIGRLPSKYATIQERTRRFMAEMEAWAALRIQSSVRRYMACKLARQRRIELGRMPLGAVMPTPPTHNVRCPHIWVFEAFELEGLEEEESKIHFFNNSAMLALKENNMNTAFSLLKQAEMALKKKAEPSPSRLALFSLTMNNLSYYYSRKKKVRVGLQYLNRAIKMERGSEFTEFMPCLTTVMHAAALFSQLGKHTTSLTYIQKAHRILHSQSITAEADTEWMSAVCFHNMAAEEIHLQHYEDAIYIAKKAIALAREHMPLGHAWRQKIERTLLVAVQGSLLASKKPESTYVLGPDFLPPKRGQRNKVASSMSTSNLHRPGQGMMPGQGGAPMQRDNGLQSGLGHSYSQPMLGSRGYRGGGGGLTSVSSMSSVGSKGKAKLKPLSHSHSYASISNQPAVQPEMKVPSRRRVSRTYLHLC